MEWQRVCTQISRYYVLRASRSKWSAHGSQLPIPVYHAIPQHALDHPQIIHVYCDIQGVIDRINCKSLIPYPCKAISDDYLIYAEIQQEILQLHPITPHFHHIKGHHEDPNPACH